MVTSIRVLDYRSFMPIIDLFFRSLILAFQVLLADITRIKHCGRPITAYHRVIFTLGKSSAQKRNSTELSMLTARFHSNQFFGLMNYYLNFSQ